MGGGVWEEGKKIVMVFSKVQVFRDVIQVSLL